MQCGGHEAHVRRCSLLLRAGKSRSCRPGSIDVQGDIPGDPRIRKLRTPANLQGFVNRKDVLQLEHEQLLPRE
jgi:hypothetical protein